ncbi:heterokaryon incompatibility protein-domain-containing protein [Immersiella caudata]|uniref:Heterokaryon incompatibility protein-domain-containing protein n=1 Tax=Immersiella caudata TaxID=314043 RepID=A0AA40BUT4_9PEZI|nr:heterokaryon incompatibility protein-domain-containing protein [Immersiella caudata]
MKPDALQHLSPRQNDSPVEGSKANPEDAWGGNRHRITVTNESGERGSLLVTKNLRDFLAELCKRQPQDVHYLWIDRICINQEEPEERASQVRMMGRIYRNCKAVIVWLGPESANTAAAFQLIHNIHPLDNREWRFGPAMKTPEARLEHYNTMLQAQAWTFQEGALPREGTFWCGSRHAPMRQFWRPVGVLANYAKVFPDPPGPLHGAASRLHLISSRTTPFFFADYHRFPFEIMCAASAASNPRDLIYSFLGVSDTLSSQIAVDYTRPVDEVFIDIALAQCYSEGPGSGSESHILFDVQDASFRGVRRTSLLGCRTCKTENVELLESSDRRILALEGFEADEVAYIGGNYPETVESDGLFKSLRLLNQCQGKHSIESFWRTLTADLTGNGPFSPDAEMYGPEFLPEWPEVLTLSMSLLPQHHKDILSNMYLRMISFTFAQQGRLGIGHDCVLPDDKVFIVRTANYPVILKEAGNGRYTAVRITYVDVIMFGEALSGSDWRRVEIG